MMCRDVVETDDAESLTGLQKLLFRFHMSICPACQAHQRQVDTTVATLGGLPKDEPSEDAREKALAAFRKNKKRGV
jgi:hypothetical protein